MKFLIVLGFALVFGISMVFTQSGARICVIRTNCTLSNGTVCARFGRSNLCRRFSNLCAYQAASCSSTATYTRVNNTYCSGFTGNVRRSCTGLTTTSNSLSSLFGSTSSSTVTPIIIQRG